MGAHPLRKPGQVGDALIDRGLVKIARTDCSRHGLSVIGARAGHTQVQAGANGLDARAHRPPIADHNAVETPFTAQNVLEQPAVLGAVHAIETVVGRHNAVGMSTADHTLERREVDFPQRPLIDDRVLDHAGVLLAVAREMLEASRDPPALDAANHRSSKFAGDQWVLAEVLEVTTAQGMALYVHTGPKQHIHALLDRLLTQRGAHLLDKRWVKRARERGGSGEAG